jgi:membrane-bound lytic murein transglycosylase D
MFKALTAVCLLCSALFHLPAFALEAPAKSVPVPATAAVAEPTLTHTETLSEPIQVEAAEVDLWQRIRAGLSMADSNDPLVQTHENSYIKRQDQLQRTLERSRPYLYHIVEQVEKRGMPMEIALLPIIESSFDPQALSPSQAAGIWQFIPSTGRIYGLDQNHWYDGRRDIVAATKAALDHLQYLYRLFNDWELTLAAYNCGEGCVARAITRNRVHGLPTNFGALSLPAETRHYVPKLLAVRNLIRAPEAYGLALENLPNQAYFQTVTLPRPLEAHAAAKLAGMNLDDFLDLNPGFRRKVIYSDTPSKLLLPVDKVDVFNRNLEQTASEMTWLRKYLAQKGESIKQIAERFDVSLQWLREHNPMDTGKKGQLKTATTMIVPAVGGARTVAVNTSVATPTAQVQPNRTVKAVAGRRVHTVRKGDTLFSLAERYNVAVAEIRALNGKLKILRPGAKLRIPVAKG